MKRPGITTRALKIVARKSGRVNLTNPDGVALNSIKHPPGLIEKFANAVRTGKLTLEDGHVQLPSDADALVREFGFKAATKAITEMHLFGHALLPDGSILRPKTRDAGFYQTSIAELMKDSQPMAGAVVTIQHTDGVVESVTLDADGRFPRKV
jgi:hypothetical protein